MKPIKFKEQIVTCVCENCEKEFDWGVIWEFGRVSNYDPLDVICPYCGAEYPEED